MGVDGYIYTKEKNGGREEDKRELVASGCKRGRLSPAKTAT